MVQRNGGAGTIFIYLLKAEGFDWIEHGGLSRPINNWQRNTTATSRSGPAMHLQRTEPPSVFSCQDRLRNSIPRRRTRPLYIERRASIGSAEAARVAGSAEASSASNIMITTVVI